MGSGIGTISIDFDASVAKFVNKTDQANGAIDKFAAKAKSAEGATDGIFGKVAGANLLAAGIEKAADFAAELAHKLVEVIEKTMEEVAAADRLAKSFDISTSSLQSLQGAAKLAGHIDADTFNSSFEKMLANIGEAVEQGGEIDDTFKRIGLDAKKLSEEGADQAFRDIAHAIGNLGTAAEKAAAAKEIFGKAGVADLPMFGKALDEAEAKARRFGVAMSEVDIGNITAADEQWENIGQQLKGIGNQIVASLAPAIETVLGTLSNLISVFGDVDAANQKLAEHVRAENAAKALSQESMKAEKEIVKVFKDLNDQYNTFGMSDPDKKIAKLRDEFQNLSPHLQYGLSQIEKLTKMLDAMKAHADGMKKLHDGFVDIDKQLAEIGMSEADKKVAEIGERFRGLPADLQPAVAKMQEMQRAINESERLQKFSDEVAKLNADIAGVADETKKWLAQFDKSGFSDEQLSRLADLHKQAEDAARFAEKQKHDVEDIKRLAEEGLSPFQKWTEEIEKMNQLLSDRKITQDEFDRAKKRVDEELRKSSGDHERETAALERRFNFKLPSQQKNDLQYQKKTSEMMELVVPIMRRVDTSTAKTANEKAMVADFG
jgi:hypothetical protein